MRVRTEPLMRLLLKQEIRVVTKPLKTLQQEFPSPKTKKQDSPWTNNAMLSTKFRARTVRGVTLAKLEDVF